MNHDEWKDPEHKPGSRIDERLLAVQWNHGLFSTRVSYVDFVEIVRLVETWHEIGVK